MNENALSSKLGFEHRWKWKWGWENKKFQSTCKQITTMTRAREQKTFEDNDHEYDNGL